MVATNISLTDSGTTNARASLEYGTDVFAQMTLPKLKRVYAAALAVAREQIEDYGDFVAYCQDLNPTTITAIKESRVRPVSGDALAVAHTHLIVSQLVSELCERDTVVIPASPTSREWSQTEGGYRAFHASNATIQIIERVMAA